MKYRMHEVDAYPHSMRMTPQAERRLRTELEATGLAAKAHAARELREAV